MPDKKTKLLLTKLFKLKKHLNFIKKLKFKKILIFQKLKTKNFAQQKKQNFLSNQRAVHHDQMSRGNKKHLHQAVKFMIITECLRNKVFDYKANGEPLAIIIYYLIQIKDKNKYSKYLLVLFTISKIFAKQLRIPNCKIIIAKTVVEMKRFPAT
ncbi:hypothetical protein RFI_19780, partial [Reticulomyxa filosa]